MRMPPFYPVGNSGRFPVILASMRAISQAIVDGFRRPSPKWIVAFSPSSVQQIKRAAELVLREPSFVEWEPPEYLLEYRSNLGESSKCHKKAHILRVATTYMKGYVSDLRFFTVAPNA